MGYMMKMSINQNPIILEMNFIAASMTWNIKAFGKTIQPTDIGIDNNKFSLTKKSVSFVYGVIQHLRICRGFTDISTSDKNSNEVFQETISDEISKCTGTFYKSVKCTKVLNFNTCTDNLCKECRDVKKR